MVSKLVYQKFICLLIFAAMIVIFQINNYVLLFTWCIIAVFCLWKFDKKHKQFLLTSFLFGLGFLIYLFARAHWNLHYSALNRIFLFFQIIPFLFVIIFLKQPVAVNWKKPEWNTTIWFPFIWSGFHRSSIKTFLIIALSINILSLFPFYIDNLGFIIKSVVLEMILFSIINATLEEVIWRGLLLHLFSNQVGEKWAVMITSIGFGLQHYSLGFSWITCFLFILGGFFYGGITVKSKSILPAVTWHIILNILMIMSGFILL